MLSVSKSQASQAIIHAPATLQRGFESDHFATSTGSHSGPANADRCLRFLRLIHSNPYSRPSAAREGAIFIVSSLRAGR
jgi:hypothetical protein